MVLDSLCQSAACDQLYQSACPIFTVVSAKVVERFLMSENFYFSKRVLTDSIMTTLYFLPVRNRPKIPEK